MKLEIAMVSLAVAAGKMDVDGGNLGGAILRAIYPVCYSSVFDFSLLGVVKFSAAQPSISREESAPCSPWRCWAENAAILAQTANIVERAPSIHHRLAHRRKGEKLERDRDRGARTGPPIPAAAAITPSGLF
ncbi:MAG: hypothetical protein ACREUM_00215 [Nitrosospira sp.]